MRLLDRLLSERFDVGSADPGLIHGVLAKSQLVVADNVVNYWATFKSRGVPLASDFPCVILPFEHTFIEMRLPRECATTSSGSVLEASGLLLTMGPRDPMVVSKSKEMEAVALECDKAKWFMEGLVFVQFRNEVPRLMCRLFCPVDGDGRVVSNTKGGLSGAFESFQGLPDSQDERLRHYQALAGLFLPPTLLTLSFMHCRNVQVRTEVPPAPLSKKHERKTGRPLLRYRVLQIDHMKQVLEHEGHASIEGLKRALHICRGHFATYGKDGKGLLFGKHVATVWIPMHSRGSIEAGVVVKDYDVK